MDGGGGTGRQSSFRPLVTRKREYVSNDRLCCVEGCVDGAVVVVVAVVVMEVVGGRTKNNVVVGKTVQGTGVYVWVVFRSNRVGKVQV